MKESTKHLSVSIITFMIALFLSLNILILLDLIDYALLWKLYLSIIWIIFSLLTSAGNYLVAKEKWEEGK